MEEWKKKRRKEGKKVKVRCIEVVLSVQQMAAARLLAADHGNEGGLSSDGHTHPTPHGQVHAQPL